jgi:4-(2-carboxyphenyl)-2-oxobut-3-enoate aldolase
MKIIPKDIVGLVGIVPTPATQDADKWQTEFSVNLSESEKMTRLVVDGGVDFLLTNGTFGECATLTEDEHSQFNACVVDTCAGSVPVFSGVGTLNTRDTIRRSRKLIDSGSDGLFVGRPMWLSLDQAQIVQFYRDIAEALPGVPIIVYDNPVAFKGKIGKEAYLQLAEIPEIVAAKHVGGPTLVEDALTVNDQCRILPLVSDWFDVARMHPELMTAAWSGHVACAPAPLVALAHAIRDRDWELAEKISEKCRWAESAMFAGGDIANFMDYSIQIGHLRFEAAGLIDPGPPRPPYVGLPEEYQAGGRETGRRWSTLQKEFERSGWADRMAQEASAAAQ